MRINKTYSNSKLYGNSYKNNKHLNTRSTAIDAGEAIPFLDNLHNDSSIKSECLKNN